MENLFLYFFCMVTAGLDRLQANRKEHLDCETFDIHLKNSLEILSNLFF